MASSSLGLGQPPWGTRTRHPQSFSDCGLKSPVGAATAHSLGGLPPVPASVLEGLIPLQQPPALSG